MNGTLRSIAVSFAALAAFALQPSDARACGGCFHEPSQTESTVVTGHRMAFSISSTRTILWDQIEYTGSPGSFAWVLPVKSGATIELSSDAWFEALDAATAVQVVSPPADCGGFGSGSSGCSFGCGAAEAGLSDNGRTPPSVTVVHQGAVGPYETVTLHANVPNALPDWLTSHGYAIDPGIAPVIDAYTNEGFDFIALRLLPGQGVQQMKPVRIVSEGMTPTLPLRMVAAGTGPNVGITLFVIGEGRWQAGSFPNGAVNLSDVVWDFKTQKSNYAEVRSSLLATNGGRTWATTYAKAGALLGPARNPSTEGDVLYEGANFQASTIAEFYVRQGLQNGETFDSSCLDAFKTIAQFDAMVSGACLASASPPAGGNGGAGPGGAGPGGAGTGGAGTGGAGTGGAGTGGATTGGAPPNCTVPVNQADARLLACGPLDDVAAALVGMHPGDVWITRMEANLPRAALAQDLTIAATGQVEQENWILVSDKNTKNNPCAGPAAALVGPSGNARGRNGIALFASLVAVVCAALARRLGRAARVGREARTIA